jgi:hypothetical protein
MTFHLRDADYQQEVEVTCEIPLVLPSDRHKSLYWNKIRMATFGIELCLFFAWNGGSLEAPPAYLARKELSS